MFLYIMAIIALRISLLPRSLGLLLTKQYPKTFALHRCIHTPRNTGNGRTGTRISSSLFKDFNDPFLITTQSNDKVKLVQSLLQSNKKKRRKSGSDGDLVVVEGVRAIHDALNSGMSAKFVLHTPVAGHSPLFPGENESEDEARSTDSNKSHRDVDEDLLLAAESLPQRSLRDNLIKKLYEPEMIRRVFRLEDRVYREISDTIQGQGFLAVMEKPVSTISSFFTNIPSSKEGADSSHHPLLVLALDRIADPGNLGTLMRSAYGLGVNGVLAIDCCDAFSAKCTRSAMAMNLRLPVLQLRSEEVVGAVQNLIAHSSTLPPSQHVSDYQVVVADGSADSVVYHTVDYHALVKNERKAIVLMIGSEAHGVSSDLHGLRTGGVVNNEKDPKVLKVKIPMVRSVDSFNAAVAGSIILADIQRKLNL